MALKDLYRVGLFSKVYMLSWSGTYTVQPEDIGFLWHELPTRFTLGKVPLIPKVSIMPFKNVYTKVNKLIKSYAYHAPHMAGDYVPLAAYPEIEKGFAPYQAEFGDLLEEFLSKYKQMKRGVRTEQIRFAEDILVRLGEPKRGEAARLFIESFLAKVNVNYPTLDQLRDKFSLGYSAVTIYHPTMVGPNTHPDSPIVAQQALLRMEMERMNLWFINKMVVDFRRRVWVLCESQMNSLQRIVPRTTQAFYPEKTFYSILSTIKRLHILNICGEKELMTLLDSLKDRWVKDENVIPIRCYKDTRMKFYHEFRAIKEMVLDPESTRRHKARAHKIFNY